MIDTSADQAARERAIDPAHSFIVQAPAGSGKTGLLTQRFLRLLAHVRAPEEVLAITFTRKAAAEMRQRIVQALTTAETTSTTDNAHAQLTRTLAQAALRRDRELDWHLIANPNRLRIQTIDSLCAELARHFPVVTELGAPPGLLEDETASAQVYLEAAHQTLRHLSDTDAGDDIRALLVHFDNDLDRTAQLLADMLKRRDRWLRHVATSDNELLQRKELESALTDLATERLSALAQQLPVGLASEIGALMRYAAIRLAQTDAKADGIAAWTTPPTDFEPVIEQLPLWQAAIDLLLTNSDEPRKKVDRRSGFPATEKGDSAETKALKQEMKHRFNVLSEVLQDQPALVASLRDLRHLPPIHYDQERWALLSALLRTLLLAAAELQLAFAETGRIDFVEMQWRALQALGDAQQPTDLSLAWDYRLQHILVDEFQDTSLGQFMLLERLCAGWMPDDGRTLFLVGDPMQSIYRFREAEVGLYLQAWRNGLGDIRLEPLTLERNFRSQAGIVDWLNTRFGGLFPANADIASGAVPYSPAVPALPAAVQPAVSLHARINRDDADEATRIADLVAATLAAGDETTVAILVRGRAQIPPIAAALRARELRYVGIDTDPLADRQVILDLHTLTRALSDPCDRIAWLALLRGPWCGLLLDDLLTLCGSRDAPLWTRISDTTILERLSEDARHRLGRLTPVFESFLAARRRLPLHRAVAALWRALGGDALAGAESAADVTAYLELLARHQQAGRLVDTALFEQALQRLYAPPDSSTDTRVQIMTMHRAKGLEFDTVILPGLGRAPRTQDQALLRWMERPNSRGTQGLLLAPMRGSDTESEPIEQGLAYLEREQAAHEALRLLYVATTRAREQLHLFAHANWNDKKAQPSPPATNSLLRHLWPVFEEAFEGLTPEEQDQTVPPDPEPPPLRRIVSGGPTSGIPTNPLQPAAVTTEAPPPIVFDWAGESARVTGILVHRWLERIAQDGVDAWSIERLDQIRPQLHAGLVGLGLCEDQVSAAARRAQDALAATLADARGRWLLQPHDEAVVEWPLTVWENDMPRHLVIDRSFVADGTRWIVDYKTSRHEGGGLEAFMDEEQERYREQLDSYARALSGLEQRPMRCALYFPVFGGWREWTPSIAAPT